MHYQTIWLILLIVFAGIEGITAGLVSIWFCAGSLVALVATWLGASLPVQSAVAGAMHSTIQRTNTMLSHCFFMISSSLKSI